jgi:hypothetical protein
MLAVMTTPASTKARPSWGWFVLGGALLVAAVASGIGLFVWTLAGFVATDATVPADGAPHEVAVPTDGDRMLWYDEGAPGTDCTVVDRRTGEPVRLDTVAGRFTRDDGGGGRVGARRLDPGSGELTITCAAAGGDTDVEIGPAPSLGGFGLGLLLTIAVPLVLGGLGLVVLLVTGILWSTRATTRR